jgi:hypothetical protein
VSVLLVFAALASSASASAEDESDAGGIRAVQLRYGECILKKKHSSARIFVLTPDLSRADHRRLIQMVGDGECAARATDKRDGVALKFPHDTMRYTLADALVRSEFSRSAPPSLKNAGPIAQPEFDETKYRPGAGKKVRQEELDALAESRARRLSLVYFAQYGECVVRGDPDQSRNLLLATPGSAEESSAFSALKPALSNCVVAGRSLKFNRATLRGTIAMNYYRLAHAPRMAPAQEAAE